MFKFNRNFLTQISHSTQHAHKYTPNQPHKQEVIKCGFTMPSGFVTDGTTRQAYDEIPSSGECVHILIAYRLQPHKPKHMMIA